MGGLQVELQEYGIKYKLSGSQRFADEVSCVVCRSDLEAEVETYHSQRLRLIDWRRRGLQESSRKLDIK